ncbi:Gfo/Idh/MocA family protein [Mesorhizobium sp. B4-1-4]|uniref:Gfo/Idh/MocA family protein n=1 Tax=Mesorhizobium sp. B4-1-4 TaxID=2589888 RepID=UPI0011278C02|nr:Gfo/Idh/MocA family oxidoreductase [Mesorhizobium sp. B4-1-4]UCI32100.1 Gfo/Idh/MocA family oxidoreductase [Mesorhizobium sp. B4-1-4]
MNDRTVRFGLIGAGVASETHARELKRVAGASLEAVFARDQTKAAAFGAAFAVPRCYCDISKFLADPDIDAVIITTPNGRHLDYAIAAAEAGKHVIIEKPLEINEERALRIVAACHDVGARLFVIYQRRYSAAAEQAVSDIRNGRLGRVILVNIVDNQYRSPAYYRKDAWRGTKSIEGGGCLITQSTHLIDLAQYLVGPIRSVFAKTGTTYHEIETEDVAVAVFEFEGGAIGTLSSSTAAFPGQRHLVTISGTEGSIIINGEHDEIVFRQAKNEPVASRIPESFSFGDPIEPRDYPTDGQRKQLQAIVSALVDPHAPATEDIEALMAVRVIDAIYRSSSEGRPVEVRHT